MLTVHVVEQPQREQQQHDGYHHSAHHDVQLYGGLLILTGSRLQLTVLTGGLLKVEILVAVIVALGLVVDGGKGHAQLLTDGGHKVGGLMDERVGKCLFEIIEGTLVIAYLTETGCERSVGTGYLIDVAILLEDAECVLGQPACQHVLVHIVRIDEFQGGQVVCQQLTAAGVVHQVFRQGLEGVGSKEWIVCLTGHEEAAHQLVELLLVDLLLGALGDDTAGSNVIEIVQPLSRITLDLSKINLTQGLDRFLLKTDVVIIGRVDDGILTLGISQTPLHTGREFVTLLIDTAQGLVGQLTELMELTVSRPTLTEAHLLYIGHHALHLVVARLEGFLQQPLRLVVLHTDDADEGHIVAGLCPALVIAARQLIGPLSIVLCGVHVTVMRSIGERIQLIHRVSVCT